MLESLGLLAPTLGQCIDRVLEHKKLHIADLSYKSLKNRIKKFTTYLLNRKLLALEPNKLTKRQIMEYLDYRASVDKISGHTRNNDLIDTKSVFSTMQDLELIKENRASRIKKVVTQSDRNRVYTDKEFKDTFDCMEKNNPYLLLFCKFIYYGMIRPVEFTRLKIADIDLENNTITIPAKNTKARTTQTVTIMEVLKEVILSMNTHQAAKNNPKHSKHITREKPRHASVNTRLNRSGYTSFKRYLLCPVFLLTSSRLCRLEIQNFCDSPNTPVYPLDIFSSCF
jgi:integrase